MSQKTSTNKKKLLLAVLLLVSMVTQFIGYPNQADAIVPYSQEFKSFGGPEDPIIVMKDGVAASKKIDEARANNTLYISSINTPFHTYAPKGVRYGEFKGWDGKIRKEKITLNSIHKMKFIIPVPRNTTILGTTAIFNVEGEVLPPEEILVPERWVSFPESGVSLPWIKASYQKNQCQLNSNVNTSVGAANPYLSLLETKDKKTSPGYYLEGDTIIFNAYLRFTTFTDSQSGVKGADNITEELKRLRRDYIAVEKLKRLGHPSYAKRKAEIEALIADYHLKVGDDAFRIQEPFIRTGKMASNSLLEGQYTYYTNPGVYFTPNDYCPSHVHKYFYTKTGDTERLDNYKTEAYDQKSGYEIKHEDGYSVVSWHTITDETKCKEEPGLVDYDIALKKFNNNAKGKEAAKLSSDTTLRPAPKGSEIAIKLIREENIPEVQDKETILEITQKRISKHFDLSPWGSKESPPVVLTYTWPSVPGCVCLKCNPGPGECTEYCYSTVEPSMTFIIDQINKTRNDLLAEVEYFLSYFENDSNYEMVSRGDEAGQHEMKPNYHYILWRGKDVPILASYKYRTKEAQEQAAPLYKHLIDAMNHKPVHPRYGLNDPNYDKEENKGIIYEDQLTLTFGGVPNYSYLEEDLQTTAMRGSCSDPVYANQKASRPVPQNLHAKVLVHCYHGLPNPGDAGTRIQDGVKVPQDGMVIDGVTFNSVWGKNSNDQTISYYPYVEMVYDSTGHATDALFDEIFKENQKTRESITADKKERYAELMDIGARIQDFRDWKIKVDLPRELMRMGLGSETMAPSPEMIKRYEGEDGKLADFKFLESVLIGTSGARTGFTGLDVGFSAELQNAYKEYEAAKGTRFENSKFMDLKKVAFGGDGDPSEEDRIEHKYKLLYDMRDVIKGDMIKALNEHMKKRMSELKGGSLASMNKVEEPVLTLAGHESKFIGRHYVETGYIKTPLKGASAQGADSGLQILSQQWSTHSRAKNLGAPNTVLPGGAIYRLLTPEEGTPDSWKTTSRTKVGVSYYQVYAPDDVLKYLSKETPLTLKAATKAVFGTEDINGTTGSASTIYKGLNSLDVVQAMSTSSKLSGSPVKPYNGVLVDQKKAGSQTVYSGQKTSPDKKYWLNQTTVTADLDEGAHKGQGGISKDVNRADLDVLETKVYETHYRIFAQVDGTIVFGVGEKASDLELNSYVSGKPGFKKAKAQVSIHRNEDAKALINKINGIGASVGKGNNLGTMLDKKTNLITGFVGSIDRVKGDDPTRTSMANSNIKGANDTKWYDEGWDGLSVVEYDKVMVIGFRDQAPAGLGSADGKFRTAVLDPKLSEANKGQADSYSKKHDSWFQTNAESDAYPGSPGQIGTVNFAGGDNRAIYLNDMGGLLKSKTFHVPNATTMNTLN